MNCSHLHSKRTPFIVLPQPQQRFNSLKASHSYLNNCHNNLTKRHSLDSRPIQYNQKHSLLDNIEDYNIITNPKHWRSSKGCFNKGQKLTNQESVRIKYYWKGKTGKSAKDTDKVKGRKVKRTWSEFGKNLDKKQKKKDISKSKGENSGKINISDRVQTKNEITNGKSDQSCHDKKQQLSGDRIKIVKSLLSSTMLTKRQSDDMKCKGEIIYADIFLRLKDVLNQYQKKVKQLREEKEYFRLKLRKLRRKKCDF